MCECGCSIGNVKYTLPGPNGSIYVIIFRPSCSECDVVSDVVIQKWPSKKAFEAMEGESIPKLPMYRCMSCWDEAVIITGKTSSEFVKDLSHHLVGLDSAEIMKYKDSKCLDDVAAEIILEEMYVDATFTPRLAGTT